MQLSTSLNNNKINSTTNNSNGNNTIENIGKNNNISSNNNNDETLLPNLPHQHTETGSVIPIHHSVHFSPNIKKSEREGGSRGGGRHREREGRERSRVIKQTPKICSFLFLTYLNS